MTEAEASAIRFTIDHYEPQNARPDLVNAYDNLMYACDECNTRKGDRCPHEDARKAGFRFFRADQDVYGDHFTLVGRRIEAKTSIGEYTIEALDLNRLSLRRLREIRERLSDCHDYVLEGLRGLRHFPVDRLPKHLKGQVTTAVIRAGKAAEQIADGIDDALRQHAKSPLIDVDPEADIRAKERTANLDAIEAIHPGSWRAPRKKRGKSAA